MDTSAHENDYQHRLPPLRVAPAQSDTEDGQLRDELLTVLLHDLRSPLGAISVLADLITAISQRGEPADARQLKLLQEAVGRAQHVLDDALEVQSVIRGSSSFVATVTDLKSLLDAVITKVKSAAYFQTGRIDLPPNAADYFVQVDYEKAETILLCIIEQIVSHSPVKPHLSFNVSANGSQVIINISNINSAPQEELARGSVSGRQTLRGRLGTRKPGESRYSLQICHKILKQMGGGLTINTDGHASMEVCMPQANR